MTQEQVRILRLSKLSRVSQRPAIKNEQKQKLEKTHQEYEDRMLLRQATNQTQLQIKIRNIERSRTGDIGVTRNQERENNVLNVIEQQPFELSLAQLRSLMRMRNSVPINENLIPNESAIRQNIPEPINLLNNDEISRLILYIMQEQNERNDVANSFNMPVMDEPLNEEPLEFPVVGADCYPNWSNESYN